MLQLSCGDRRQRFLGTLPNFPDRWVGYRQIREAARKVNSRTRDSINRDLLNSTG